MFTSRSIVSSILPVVSLACLAISPSAWAQASDPTKPAAKQQTSSATLKLGDAAPPISIAKWVKGDAVTGFEPGKVYVVEFWATWCGPCIASMPHLSELQRQYRDQNVRFIGVTREDTRGNTLEAVQQFVEERGAIMDYAVAWDDGRKTSDAYMKAADQRGIPASFVVDQKGKVAFIGHPSELDYVLEQVVGNKWNVVEGPKTLREIAARRSEIIETAGTDPVEALKRMTAFEKEYPVLAKGMREFRYRVQLEAGDKDGAAATGAKIVDDAIAAKSPEALNEWAWNIVDPEADVKHRDVDLAMRAATEANRLTNGKDAGILDTLARCYWLKNDRARAIELQKQAVEAADEGPMRDQIRLTLKEYEQGSKN